MGNVCCGKCKWNRWSTDAGGFVCSNEESENYGLETGYSDSCVDGERRDAD